MTEVYPGVMGLSGGTKQMWLRQHRAEVLAFYHRNGPDATMIRFNLRQNTLKAFLVGKAYNPQNMTETQRALDISKTAIEMSRENNRQIVGLREKIDELAPLTEIVKGFTRAMALTWERESPKNDRLELTDFKGESEE